MSMWLITLILMATTITLPHKFKPRDYQLPFLAAMDRGIKRACCVWHRRAGKDKTFLNYTIKCMAQRVGQYYYYFPTMAQGRRSLWEGIDRDGFPFLRHFPPAWVRNRNDQEMRINAPNESIFRVVGTDKLEVVGPNPVGCVFSEYSLEHPKGWQYVRPILAENQGWAAFNFTPRGKNHGYQLYRMAQGNPDWFAELLTVDKTHAITQEAIDAERRAGMSEALIQQEFYCSFEYGAEGVYYNEVVNWLYEEGRIGVVKHNASLPVYTVHDPGYHWAIWFFQPCGPDIAFIRCYEELGVGVENIAQGIKDLVKEHGYRYGGHYAPIDTESNSAYKAVAGKSLKEHAAQNGLDLITLTPELKVNDGIERTRQFLHQCWIDAENCEIGLNALQSYCRKEIVRASTEDRHIFVERPDETNWARHLADAMRYASKAVKLLPSRDNEAEIAEHRRLQEKYRRPA